MKPYTFLLTLIVTAVVCTAAPAKKCLRKADIVFVLDGSGSVATINFKQMKQFVKGVVDELNIEDGSRVGIVEYSRDAEQNLVPLGQHKTKQSIKSAIDNIKQSKGRTRTDLGLAAAKEFYKKSAPGVVKVIVVITDGRSSYPAKTKSMAVAVQAAGIKIIAIGVGIGADKAELDVLATDPDQDNAIYKSNFQALKKDFASTLAGKACEPIKPIVPVAPAAAPAAPPCLGGDEAADAAVACSGAKADIVFVVDSSGSVGDKNFNKMKDFVKQVTDALDIGKDTTRVGLLTYSASSKIRFGLGARPTKSSIKASIDAIHYTKYGQTNTGEAIQKMVGMFTTRGPKIGVVITDGNSNIKKITVASSAKLAKDRGITLVAVGIGSNIRDSELNLIASDPDSTHKLEIKDFDSLIKFTKSLAKMTCGVAKSK